MYCIRKDRMKLIANLVNIELVDMDLGLGKTMPMQKLSFDIKIFPYHEMYSFHIPMTREEGNPPFVIGKYYDINITEVSEEKEKEIKDNMI